MARLIAGVILCTLLAAVSRAQEQPSEGVELDVETGFITDARLKASGGLSLGQESFSIDATVPLAGDSQAGAEVDFIFQQLRWKLAGADRSGEASYLPDENINIFSIQPTGFVTLSKGWTGVAELAVSGAAEKGAPLAHAILLTEAVSVVREFSKDLKIGVGLSREGRMSSSPLILPFPVIDWKLAQGLELTSLDGESGRLAYQFAPSWKLFGQLEFKEQDIRLSRRSAARSGVIREESYPLTIGTEFTAKKVMVFSLWAGPVLSQQLQLLNSSGSSIARWRSVVPFSMTGEFDFRF